MIVENKMSDELETLLQADEDGAIAEAQRLLPAWFVDRMMADTWYFGLLTISGTVIGIETILRVYQAGDGSIWLDAILLTESWTSAFKAPTARTTASINTSHIVAAFELADS